MIGRAVGKEEFDKLLQTDKERQVMLSQIMGELEGLKRGECLAYKGEGLMASLVLGLIASDVRPDLKTLRRSGEIYVYREK